MFTFVLQYVAVCWNMLHFHAFSCLFPFQHSLPAQKNKHGQLPKRCFASLILSRELQLGLGQCQLGALYKLPQRLELDHEAQCPAKWSISQKISTFLKHKHIKWLKRYKTSQRESNIASICSTSGFFSHLWPPFRPPSSLANRANRSSLTCGTGGIGSWHRDCVATFYDRDQRDVYHGLWMYMVHNS